MDGVAGHAGIFSTIADLALYDNMLPEGRYGKNLKRQLFKPKRSPDGEHSISGGLGSSTKFGWDVATGYSSPRENFPPVNLLDTRLHRTSM
jgi:CubicO group peptidase (beta-lactamase class C family)